MNSDSIASNSRCKRQTSKSTLPSSAPGYTVNLPSNLFAGDRYAPQPAFPNCNRYHIYTSNRDELHVSNKLTGDFPSCESLGLFPQSSKSFFTSVAVRDAIMHPVDHPSGPA
ncbi:hypothetical protein L484_005766 [Morus notabilis]|uniref:Uncharacterized protein n=1 Tax=Morus notabilis TaxID=981085 RepID=W9SSE1_9ROSA|nr:hypothetical protein L484_005766 [Morus notabilis]